MGFHHRLQFNLVRRLFLAYSLKLKNTDLESNEFKIFKIISQKFKEITNCTFNIVPSRSQLIQLKFKVKNKWMNAEDCGIGLKDILVIITHVFSKENTLFLLEEPENHLHPEFQKKLLNLIIKSKGNQFIISTHSKVFIDNDNIDKIYYCWFDDKVNLSDKTSQSKIIDSLGYSITENLSADVIILTEGPTDIPVLKRLFKIKGLSETYNIIYWSLGGDIMALQDLSLFAESSNVFAIIDNDPKSGSVRKEFMENCKKSNIDCTRLEYYSIENYIPLYVYKTVFPNQISNSITELKTNESIDQQIEFTKNKKTVKRKLATLANLLSLDDIKGTDLNEFCNKIEAFLNHK